MNLFDRPLRLATSTTSTGIFESTVAAVESDGPLEPSVLATRPLPAVPKATTGLRRLSHSEIVSFLTCARLHYFSYRLRREPKTTAEPLLVGRRVESIIKQLWLGQTPDLSELPPEERALCKAYPIWWRLSHVARQARGHSVSGRDRWRHVRW